MNPTEADKAEAKRLYEEGWLPISNAHRMVALVPKTVDYSHSLARANSRNGENWGSALYKEGDQRRGKAAMYAAQLNHWAKFSKQDQREHYARVHAPSKTVSFGVYRALKALAGAYNRG